MKIIKYAGTNKWLWTLMQKDNGAYVARFTKVASSSLDYDGEIWEVCGGYGTQPRFKTYEPHYKITMNLEKLKDGSWAHDFDVLGESDFDRLVEVTKTVFEEN